LFLSFLIVISSFRLSFLPSFFVLSFMYSFMSFLHTCLCVCRSLVWFSHLSYMYLSLSLFLSLILSCFLPAGLSVCLTCFDGLSSCLSFWYIALACARPSLILSALSICLYIFLHVLHVSSFFILSRFYVTVSSSLCCALLFYYPLFLTTWLSFFSFRLLPVLLSKVIRVLAFFLPSFYMSIFCSRLPLSFAFSSSLFIDSE
jgi:hypothetical protein